MKKLLTVLLTFGLVVLALTGPVMANNSRDFQSPGEEIRPLVVKSKRITRSYTFKMGATPSASINYGPGSPRDGWTGILYRGRKIEENQTKGTQTWAYTGTVTYCDGGPCPY